MPLRVTQGMMQSQLLRNLSNNVKRMSNTENELTTARKLNKPSDDPVGITYALRYRSELSINEQYQKNIDFAKSSVDHTDTVLGQINDIIQRASELTVKGVSGTNPQDALNAIAKEIGSLFDEVITLGNSQMNGKYIFNGQFTDKKPYTTGTESTDTAEIKYEFSAGVVIPINITGNEVFGEGTENDNLFTVLKGIQNAFVSGDQATARDFMEKLKVRQDKFSQVRSEVGARANRIDLMDNRLKDLEMNLTSMSSKTEDADMAETMIRMQRDENVYQASLSSGAKIIQPSLLDYLR
ncbi:flagellar hook-associated protein FlgL [Paenibacillus tyrfis]|uniref:flagellar hook-associated protein FlgL n=1 Tax=Paenibacillus tyrfis TaxID=1501230 RepID=UPI000B591359|nr:flagellar hook-associated protein FlgL [Paenibacillus tyrfis]